MVNKILAWFKKRPEPPDPIYTGGDDEWYEYTGGREEAPKKSRGWLLLFFILFFGKASADCVLQGPLQLTSTHAEGFGEFVDISANVTRLFYTYAVAPSTAFGSATQVAYRDFDKIGRSWSAPVVLDSSFPIAARGGDIGGHLHFFRALITSGVFISLQHAKSTDLNGTSWGSPDTVYTFTGGQRGNPDMGPMVTTGIAGEYIASMYYHAPGNPNPELGDDWKVGYMKTTDSGDTWTAYPTAFYSGDLFLGEQAIQYIGNNRLFYLIRNNANGNLRQAYSLNNGVTWSNPDNEITNFGSTSGVSMPKLYYDSVADRMVAVYHDRGTQRTYISYADPDLVIGHPNAWQTPVVLASGFKFFGYPVLTKADTNTYLVVYTRDSSPSDQSTARLWWLIYKIGTCVDPGLAVCGENGCEVGENCSNCAPDCGACPILCGNGSCAGLEDCNSCSLDCGECTINTSGSGVFSGLTVDGLTYR